MNVYLSEEAHRGWADLARTQGTTITALMEALGLRLDVMDEPDADWLALVEEARRIHAERLSRRQQS